MYFVLQCLLVQKGGYVVQKDGYVLKCLINSCLFFRGVDQTLKPHIPQTDSNHEPVQIRLDFYSIITSARIWLSNQSATEGLSDLHREMCRVCYYRVCIYSYNKVPWNIQTSRVFLSPQALTLPVYNLHTFTLTVDSY